MANPFATLFADDEDDFADGPSGVGGNAATESVGALAFGVLALGTRTLPPVIAPFTGHGRAKRPPRQSRLRGA